MQEKRQGIIEALLETFLLKGAFDWLEQHFGFGRGCSCTGLIFGIIILCIALYLFCNIVTNTGLRPY